MQVVDATGVSVVPAFWCDVGWARPYHFIRAVEKVDLGERVDHSYVRDKVVSGFDYARSISRRSLTQVSDEPLSTGQLNSVLRCVYQALSVERDIVAGIITWNVEGWADGAWIVEHEPRAMRRSLAEFSPALLSRMLQGQAWAQGTGIYVVLCLDWRVVHAAGSDVNAAYASALVKAGRIGHALLLEGQHQNLVARMTPAIHESTVARVFRLSGDIAPMYAMRLAEPAQ